MREEPASPPCFLRGTHILTDWGNVPVEQLVPGQRAFTLGGGRRRIAWVGSRRLDLSRHPRPQEAWPVRIRRGAIGSGVPERDLLVSPDHALLLNRVLIPAHVLVNGATVLRDPTWQRLDYFHVALETHDVLLAEGAPAESYPDRGSRAAFGADRVLLLHPRFADIPPSLADCAPRALRGPAVQEARQVLLVRARVLGHALTRDPDLHLLIDGTRVNAAGIAGATHRFAIPPGARDIRIVSRASVPAETDSASEDRRRLGVMLSRITLHVDDRTTEIAASAPCLNEGFHPPERIGAQMARWTDGHARLPPLPHAPAQIDLHVLAAQPAWVRVPPPDTPMHRSA
jgi:hypothetical protein